MPGIYQNPFPANERQEQIDAASLEVYDRYSGFSTTVDAAVMFTEAGLRITRITEIRIEDRADLPDNDPPQVGAVIDAEDFDDFILDLQDRYPLAF